MEYTLTLVGQGETKEAAFAKIFSQIQGKVKQCVKGIPIRIEPMDVNVTSANVMRYTERFLGLLFPRERRNYQIQAQVRVKVSFVDTDDIEFVERRESLPLIQRVMKLR
jgi:uncharacterized protein (TIGR03578 family)